MVPVAALNSGIPGESMYKSEQKPVVSAALVSDQQCEGGTC